MSTIRDAEDALLDAKVEAMDAIDAAVQEWYSPMEGLAIGMMWAKVPEPVKVQLRKMNPGAVNKLEKALGKDVKNKIEFGG